MPAQRSRTAGWRHCLNQIRDRRGSIELAVRPSMDTPGTAPRGDLLFRARVLGLEDGVIRVETPVSLGQPVEFVEGLELVAIIAVGQNRWMFHTEYLGPDQKRSLEGVPGMRLSAPKHVERCQRRRDYRIDTADLHLPDVRLWPLLEPASVIPAERLTAVDFERELDGMCGDVAPSLDEDLMPTIGPEYAGRIVNLGGGGLGLAVGVEDAGVIGRYANWWIQFELLPSVVTPVRVTARVAHRHLRSDRSLYCGLCFDFSQNPSHRQVVARQIMRAIAGLQRRQMAVRKAG
ncbi:MAG: hypothetical protein QF561_02575 [Phycisphaerales bacterium]|nr:hypothetical protein [Phycisphaerales bacterium]